MPESSRDAPVLSHRVGEHILVITLNRPHKHNAINVAASRALAALVDQVEADETIRVAILTGAGTRSFCAGADLDDIAAGRGNALAIGERGMGGLMFAARSKSWIAAVRGIALGGGMEAALACDMIVAGASATFGLPETRHGLIAAAGGVFRAAQRLPRAVAIEMLATGLPISAQQAQAHGMVNHVVADDAVLDRALALAGSIVVNAPLAVRESLRIARNAGAFDEESLRAMMDQAVGRLLKTEDLQEGLRAFVEKRAPRWTMR